jgi:hypothetical protein
MADFFISYSKADRDKVVMLAAYLESEGRDGLVGLQSCAMSSLRQAPV